MSKYEELLSTCEKGNAEIKDFLNEHTDFIDRFVSQLSAYLGCDSDKIQYDTGNIEFRDRYCVCRVRVIFPPFGPDIIMDLAILRRDDEIKQWDVRIVDEGKEYLLLDEDLSGIDELLADLYQGFRDYNENRVKHFLGDLSLRGLDVAPGNLPLT